MFLSILFIVVAFLVITPLMVRGVKVIFPDMDDREVRTTDTLFDRAGFVTVVFGNLSMGVVAALAIFLW